MSRKIEIELTSARPDGTWTWRVAGAKQPRGVLEGSILPAEAKVGDVLRAEAEFELDGTVITSVLPAPTKRVEPERLEILGDRGPFEAVTTTLVPKTGRSRRATRQAVWIPRPTGGFARGAAHRRARVRRDRQAAATARPRRRRASRLAPPGRTAPDGRIRLGDPTAQVAPITPELRTGPVPAKAASGPDPAPDAIRRPPARGPLPARAVMRGEPPGGAHRPRAGPTARGRAARPGRRGPSASIPSAHTATPCWTRCLPRSAPWPTSSSRGASLP